MRQLLFILLALCFQHVNGQTVYVSMVDSAVKTMEKREITYGANSTYLQFDRDSNVTARDSVRFVYADTRGRNLLMVSELKWSASDTCGIVYYFKEKKLIKIFASIRSGNITTEQSFYFKNNKLIFPTNYRNRFEVDDYIERSRSYLKFRTKNLYSDSLTGRVIGP